MTAPIIAMIQNRTKTKIPELASTHEEDSDTVTFGVNFIVSQQQAQCVTLASSDTDIFVRLLYHLIKRREAGLEVVWLVRGSGTSRV